jgi:hypothetical protein
MVFANAIPGLIKRPDGELKPGKVLRSSIRSPRPGMITMKVAFGLKAKTKRVREGSCEQLNFPEAHVFLHPIGTKKGLLNRDAVTRVFTNADDIFVDLMQKYKKMEKGLMMAMQENAILKKNMRDLIAEIKKTQSENPIIIAHAEGIAQSMQ